MRAFIVLRICAALAALFPSVVKVYETSYAFRESTDPSTYDEWRDYFETSNVMFSVFLLSDKTLMRIHLFIMPYMVAAALMWVAYLVKKSTSQARPFSSAHSQRSWLIVRKVLRRSVNFPAALQTLGVPARVTIGEIAVVVVFLFMNWAIFFARVERALFRGSRKLVFLVDQDRTASRARIPDWSWQACEIWALTIGIMAVINMGWFLFLPISKRSVFLEMFGVSWDVAIKYHRWMGYYTFWLAVIHATMYLVLFIANDGSMKYDPDSVMIKHNLNPGGCNQEGECDEDQQHMLRRNWYGISALAILLVMVLFSLSNVRRKYFNLFYYMHHLFMLILVFLCLHYKGTIILILPGIAVYFVDKLLGQLAYVNTGLVEETQMVSPEVLEVSVKLSSSATYSAGQYVFVNVPAVSLLEWHPYSITSAPHENNGETLTFHIKDLGDWTEKVCKEGKNGTLKIALDGFYGMDLASPILATRASNILVNEIVGGLSSCAVLIGGGIGITPMISVASSLLHSGRVDVTILWVCRSVEEFLIFGRRLAIAAAQDKHLTVKVWITMKGGLSEISKEDVLAKCEGAAIAPQNKPAACKQPSKFAPDYLALTPAVQSFVSALAILTSTAAFGLSQYVGSENEWGADTQRILDLFFVCMAILMVVATVIAVIVVAPMVMTMRQKSTVISSTVSSRTNVPVPYTRESPSEQTIMQAVQDMLNGRVGMRPDISAEFKKIGASASKSFDIKVLACGPDKLIEKVNEECNERQWLHLKPPFYDFKEEDWNW